MHVSLTLPVYPEVPLNGALEEVLLQISSTRYAYSCGDRTQQHSQHTLVQIEKDHTANVRQIRAHSADSGNVQPPSISTR